MMESPTLSVEKLAKILNVTIEQAMVIMRETLSSAQPSANSDKTTAEKPPVKDEELDDDMSDSEPVESDVEPAESDGESDDESDESDIMEVDPPDDTEVKSLQSLIADMEKALSKIRQDDDANNKKRVEAKTLVLEAENAYNNALNELKKFEIEANRITQTYEESCDTLRELRETLKQLQVEKNEKNKRKIVECTESRRAANRKTTATKLNALAHGKRQRDQYPVTSLTSPTMATVSLGPVAMATALPSPTSVAVPVDNRPLSTSSNNDITLEMVFGGWRVLTLLEPNAYFTLTEKGGEVCIQPSTDFLRSVPMRLEAQIRNISTSCKRRHLWYESDPTKIAIVCTIDRFAVMFGVKTSLPHCLNSKIETMGVSHYQKGEFINPFRTEWKWIVGTKFPNVDWDVGSGFVCPDPQY